MSSALVFGGTRFLSLHLVRLLVARGWEVTTLTRASIPSERVRALRADRRDPGSLRGALSGMRFDAAFDVAYAPTSGDDVRLAIRALSGAVRRYVFVSSCLVYDPRAHTRSLDEAAPRRRWGDGTAGQYVRDKLDGEDALDESGIPHAVARPSHIYGPDNTRANETWIWERASRGAPIPLPGRGRKRRPFAHVDDVAAALVAMAERAAEGAFNLVGDECPSQREFVELCLAAADLRAELVDADEDAPLGDNLNKYAHSYCYDNARAKTVFGWRPRALRDGLRETFAWWRASRG